MLFKINNHGIGQIIPILISITIIGALLFLLISSSGPFSKGPFLGLFPKYSSHAAGVDTAVTNLTLASTYESVSVYASFSGDTNGNNTATLMWRKVGDASWKVGMAMTVDRRATVTPGNVANPYVNQWRASVIGLTKNTNYEIQVTFSDPDGVSGTNPITQTTTTRNDQYPSPGNSFYVSPTGLDTNTGTQSAPFKTIQHAVDTAQAGETIVIKAGTYLERVTINPKPNSDSNHFLTIKNFGTDKPIIDASSITTACGVGTGSLISGTTTPARCGMLVSGSFIHIVGLEIVNTEDGIKINPPSKLPTGVTDNATHDVIIDNNLIHNLVFSGAASVPIYAGNSNAANNVFNLTIQNNQLHAAPGDPNYGIIHFNATLGGHVIRGNQMYFHHQGTSGVHGSDCIGGLPNTSIIGGQTKDTDIYNNYCEGATDDAYSLDGGGVNERVWNNVAYKSNVGVSIAPIIIGPTYIYRNVFHDLVYHWTTCLGLKNGEDGTGFVYIYHNTFEVSDPQNLCTNPAGSRRGFAAWNAGSGNASENLIFKNNILQGYDESIVLSQPGPVPTLVYDYDLQHNAITLNNRILEFGGQTYHYFHTTGTTTGFVEATGQETHGFYASPQYVASASADFHLKSGSAGINQGAIIPGFNDTNSSWPFQGSAPDIGAFEFATASTPSPTPSPTPMRTVTPTPSPSQSVSPCQGADLNHDSKVDIFDYNILVGNFGKSGVGQSGGDIDGNGKVDIFDYNIVVGNFGKTAC